MDIFCTLLTGNCTQSSGENGLKTGKNHDFGHNIDDFMMILENIDTLLMEKDPHKFKIRK